VQIKRIDIESHKIFKGFSIEFESPKVEYFGDLNLTAIVGENGTGKSTLLEVIIDKFCPEMRKNFINTEEKIEIDLEINGDLIEKYNVSSEYAPQKVIASSFAVFDYYSYSDKVLNQKWLAKHNSGEYRTEYVYCGPIENQFSSKDLIINLILNMEKYFDEYKSEKLYKLLGKVGYSGTMDVEINTSSFMNLVGRLNGRGPANYGGGRDYSKISDDDHQSIMNYIERCKSRKFRRSSRSGNKIIPFDFFMEELFEGYTKMIEFDLNSGVRDIRFRNTYGDILCLSEMSSGELTMLYRFLPLINEVQNNSIVIIDEPETHLHPRWVQEFIGYLVELFKDQHAHIILATHSPEIVSDIPRECIIGLKKIENGVVSYSPKDRTLGAESTELLRDVFRIKESSSQFAISMREDIEGMLEKEKLSDDELSIVLKMYNDLGTSLEKYNLFKKYKEILEKSYVEK